MMGAELASVIASENGGPRGAVVVSAGVVRCLYGNIVRVHRA